MRLPAVASALLLLACSHIGLGAQLSVVRSINNDIYTNVALQAAEATIRAIQRQTGRNDFSLRDVPLDSFQFFIGRQHHLAVEVGGQQFELVLNNNPPPQQQQQHGSGAGQRSSGASQPTLPALPTPKEASSSALAEFDPMQWQRQRISLPEVTLAGPVELVFSRTTDLQLFLPHSTDVPRAKRLLVAPGAALTLRQLRGISLRKPVDLPHLPGSYLAEVFAHLKLGEAEPGFDNAPGMLYLAGELYRAATNASLGLGSSKTKQLLSFEIEPAGSSVTIVSASQPGSSTAPRLKLKKQPDGSVSVGLRDSDESDAALQAAKAAAAPGGVAPGAVAQQMWAWPLPAVGLQDWLPYESLLRSVLAAQPLNLQNGLQNGIGLRLTKSSIKGVSLVAFDMELKTAAPSVAGPADGLLDPDMLEEGQESLEVWEAVVEVKEKGQGQIDFSPVSVKLKHAYHSTLTLSPSAVALALGAGNSSQPLGTESSDLGLARSAAERQAQ